MPDLGMKPLFAHCNLALGLQLNAAGEAGSPNSTRPFPRNCTARWACRIRHSLHGRSSCSREFQKDPRRSAGGVELKKPDAPLRLRIPAAHAIAAQLAMVTDQTPKAGICDDLQCGFDRDPTTLPLILLGPVGERLSNMHFEDPDPKCAARRFMVSV
jgi:hypothetical protein